MISAKLGAWADPEFGPADPAPAAPRELRDAMPLIINAAPAIAMVARVTDVCSVDLPF